MGLLDFNNPELLQAFMLLRGRHGELPGLLGNIAQMQDRRKRDSLQEQVQKQAMEAQKLQIDQLRRQQADQDAIRSLAQRSTRQVPVAFQPSVDDEGNAMPNVPTSGQFDPQQFAQGLMSTGLEPMKGVALQAQLAQMQNKEFIKAAPGESILRRDGNNLVPLHTTPNNPPPGFTRGPNGLVPDQEWLKAQQAIRAAGRPQVSVNTNMPPLEKREQGDQGALNVKNFGDLQTAANVARKENALLSGIEKLNLETNALTPANVTVSAWVNALGGGQRFANKAAQGEGFTAFVKDLVLQRQLAQKGPQTESDARRLEQTMAQLGNTTEANKLIVSFNKAANKRIIDQEKFYRDWWRAKKTYEGADEAWFSGRGGSSIWDEPELQKFQGTTAGVIDFSQLPPGR